MNQKELNELRRRFRLDKNNFSRVYGCYVNSNKEIIAWVDTSMGLMRQDLSFVHVTRPILPRPRRRGKGRNGALCDENAQNAGKDAKWA